MDCVTHTNVFKHIHLLHKSLDNTDIISSYSTEAYQETSTQKHSRDEYFANILSNSKSKSIQLARDKASNEVHKILSLISKCNNIEALDGAIKHLNSAIGIINALTENPVQVNLHVVKSISPNAIREKQITFHSTRKPRSQLKITLRKPGLEDQENIKNKLLNSDVTICGICLKEEDPLNDATINGLNVVCVEFGSTHIVFKTAVYLRANTFVKTAHAMQSK